MSELKREIRFVAGYNCVDFECVNGQANCGHGKSGMGIMFVVMGDNGAVEFVIDTGWYPYYNDGMPLGNRLMYGQCRSEPHPGPVMIHSPKQESPDDKASDPSCRYLGGKPCYLREYYLMGQDAFYSLVNGGEDGLWKFMESVYSHFFISQSMPIEVSEFRTKPRALSQKQPVA